MKGAFEDILSRSWVRFRVCVLALLKVMGNAILMHIRISQAYACGSLELGRSKTFSHMYVSASPALKAALAPSIWG